MNEELVDLKMRIGDIDKSVTEVKALIALSIGNAATGLFEDTSDNDGVTYGTLLDYQIITGATGTTLTGNTWGSILCNLTQNAQMAVMG